MTEYDCASCENRICRDGVDCYDVAERVRRLYDEADPLCMTLLRTAAKVESEGYMRWPRALEIIRFAKAAGFSHLGVAFCVGLSEEANAYVTLLKEHFEVSSVCCKVCGIAKSEFELTQIRDDGTEETMCSPLAQAELLNQAGTELNVVMGLCVGHDALFVKYSAAPVTTLIAKDRVLAHNPTGALYSQYWRRQFDKPGKGI